MTEQEYSGIRGVNGILFAALYWIVDENKTGFC